MFAEWKKQIGTGRLAASSSRHHCYLPQGSNRNIFMLFLYTSSITWQHQTKCKLYPMTNHQASYIKNQPKRRFPSQGCWSKDRCRLEKCPNFPLSIASKTGYQPGKSSPSSDINQLFPSHSLLFHSSSCLSRCPSNRLLNIFVKCNGSKY